MSPLQHQGAKPPAPPDVNQPIITSHHPPSGTVITTALIRANL
ncbi:MAG: hypothetical protein ABI389_16560 [Rhodanobacter sp.]